jgi:ring-1,2-phenylacetyl-CoA epoxidase subunit PaaC
MTAQRQAGTLAPDVAGALRDLILALADGKRLLGMRYAGWVLGAPELEAGIACASMAQDEWGHSRLLYALLKEFGDDPAQLEHFRDAEAYFTPEALDHEPGAWPELVALNAFLDAAFTVQLEALRGSAHGPLAQRVEKVLDEERFHTAHAAAWVRRLARRGGNGNDAAEERRTLADAAGRIVPVALRWLAADPERAAALREAGIVAASAADLRTRYLERVGGLLELLGASAVGAGAEAGEPPAGFDARRRRAVPGGPDAETLARVRGDRNRVFLME